MSIESGSASQGTKAVAGSQHASGKKPGKADAGAGGAASGFSALMSLLSATDPLAEEASDALLVPLGDNANGFDKNMPLALTDNAQIAINLVTNSTVSTVNMAASPGQSELSESVPDPALGGLMAAVPSAAGKTAVGKTATENTPVPAGLTAFQGQSPAASLPLVQPGSGGLMAAMPVAAGSTAMENTAVPAGLTPLQGQSPVASLPLAQPGPPGLMAAVPSAAGKTVVGKTALEKAAVPAGLTVLQGQSPGTIWRSSRPEPSGLMSAVPGVQGQTVASDLPTVIPGRTSPTSVSSNPSGAASLVSIDKAAPSLVSGSEVQQLTAAQAVQQQVGALLGHRSAVLQQTLTAIQAELREVKTQSSFFQVADATDAAVVLSNAGLGEMLIRPQDRMAAKSAGQQPGSGFEGAFGAASASTARADAAFEIAPPSAVVPEASIAETVSHWVTRGVQSAELTLDGFGSEPVEVSISLNGDQAQVDFRTDQAEVRQVLQDAMAQLKDLLSGEGLQLTGVSVGLSGRNSAQGDDRQQKPSASRQTAPVPDSPAVSTPSRNLNLSVGQRLDLFA